jgi:hypothetical protein
MMIANADRRGRAADALIQPSSGRDLVRMVVPAAVLLGGVLACGSETTEPPGETPGPSEPAVTSFSFLAGTWTVQSEFVTGAGVETTSAWSIVQSSLGSRVHKERWIGRRDGVVVELLGLFGRSERAGSWVAARADGQLGTFDVLEGTFSNGVGTFTTRSGSRPDAGRERVRYDSISDDGFRVVFERSTDSGATWGTYGTMRYRRASGSPAVETPPDPAPGCTAPEYHQFDFWIGSWAIGNARSDINRLLGGCIIDENWSSSESGTSFNMYDARTGRWTQLWIDTNDNTLFIQGGVQDGGMRMSNPNNRITWTDLGDGRVRQLGESTPDGTNWTTIYDLIYVPR